MTSAPGLPPNPTLIMADSSALIQTIISEEVTPLRILRQDYGIRVVVHEAVEAEIKWRIQKTFPGKLPTLKKILSTNTVEVLSRTLLTDQGYKASTALIEQIETLGQRFSLRIDRGEAYSHAAGNVLGVPTLTQDLTAIWALIDDGIDVQRPILRAFDAMIFGVQIQVIDWAACAKARRHLHKAGEDILPCFANCSVEDGVANFYLRLCDADTPPIGANGRVEKFDDRIYIRKLART